MDVAHKLESMMTGRERFQNLAIELNLHRELKATAAREGITMRRLVEPALRNLVMSRQASMRTDVGTNL